MATLTGEKYTTLEDLPGLKGFSLSKRNEMSKIGKRLFEENGQIELLAIDEMLTALPSSYSHKVYGAGYTSLCEVAEC